jgi:hypothetical protein
MKTMVVRSAQSTTPTPATMLLVAALQCQKQMERFLDPYRPERHYMRGPGPKCREKRDLPAGV